MADLNFTEWTSLPHGFLEAQASELINFSKEPLLIHLPGRKAQPLFLTILLHGNEDTGWRALQLILRKYAGRELPRRLSVFIGNIDAAAAQVRRLEGQVDYNRVWPGTPLANTAEAELMARVQRRMQMLNPFAFIDIHNNTGMNPYYACITEVNSRNLYLARLFSRIVVYFRTPPGTAAAAMNSICPSITVECGKAGLTAGDEHAANLIDAALHLDHFPESDHTAHDVEVFHTVATVKIPAEVSLAFGDTPADVRFPAQFDAWNFRELEAGTIFARSGAARPLEVTDESGTSNFTEFFSREGEAIRLSRPAMPAMITLNEQIIRQDCLCYLMERYTAKS